MQELEQTIQLRKTNAAAAIDIVRGGEGKRQMDQIRSRIRLLINREEMEYDQLAQRSARASFARTAAFLSTIGLNLAFLGWVYRRLDEEMKERRAAADRLQNTIDSISDGLMVLDRDWRITYLSRQGARILHAEAITLEGKNLWEALPQAKERKMCPQFLEAMEKREPRHIEEHYSMHDQWLEIHCYPSQEGLTVYFHDITERKKAEEVLARSRDELEKLVAERTAKLQELVGELEHFSYTITHDMRSPLRAMTGFAEVLEELGPSCPPEQRQHFLSRITAAARRMDLLISDALNYNRAVREELPLEPVDVGALLRGMLDTYPELQPTRARIIISGEMPWVLGNEAGLTQCFSNLLGNAVKFVERSNQPRVTIRAEDRDAWTRIWVEDNGIGIAAKDLSKIFDMFARVGSNYEGTGIGLALVRKVVDRMGGRLGVESELGKGSRFWIELKRMKAPESGQKILRPAFASTETR
jgi:PAS domain S-box-containing protein